MLHTKTQGNCCFFLRTTLKVECANRLSFRDGPAKYYHAPFCNGHLITPRDSNRHTMVAAIYHIDFLSE